MAQKKKNKLLIGIGRAFLIAFLAILSWGLVVLYQGYQTYELAIRETPLSEMIASIKQKPNYTLLSEMPELYQKAVVAVEDHRFYEHHGIDLVSIANALLYDIKSQSFAVGGSSITQQLSKNTYFTQEKKITRKVAEVFMAMAYEAECSKDDILELYLNTCYFGEGCYTVKEASQLYFHKNPIAMTDDESTLLAGIPNAPSVYAPTKNPDLAYQRQRQVLSQMVKYGVISTEKAQEILDVRTSQ